MTSIESPVRNQESRTDEPAWVQQLQAAPQIRARVLLERIQHQQVILTDRLIQVYGNKPSTHQLVNQLIQSAVQVALSREDDLWQLDLYRQAHPDWHQQGAVGYTAYVDQFAGTLQGVSQKIDYLKSLGVTYLHLLPFFKAAAGPNDGGFAVAHFEEVAPALGSQADLRQLTRELRQAGISLCSDFVLNHVAQDHDWALKAKSGDAAYQQFFCTVKSPEDVATWEKTLPQIFPDTAPGNFTFQPQLNAWVWTTFYPYQWDLNYANPQVFFEVVSAMMRVANMGVEAFRLDSTGFLWKREGTTCQNQPEVHCLLQALRALFEISCPGVLLKAEAIMPTQQLPPYFGLGDTQGPECHLAYHSSLMAASWVALSEQNISLIESVLSQTPSVPLGSAWLTYVRCHDDIGWNVLKPDVQALGDTHNERLFNASQFFAGLTAHSYSQGAAFQATHDKAVHGTNGMASALVGLLSANTPETTQAAIDRLLLLQSLSFFVGGLPLIYMGDEFGLANTSATELASRQGPDGRELHRPYWSDTAAAQRKVQGSPANLIFSKMQQLSQLRKQWADFHGNASVQLQPSNNEALLCLKRGQHVWGLFNFSQHPQEFSSKALPACHLKPYGFTWFNISTDGRLIG